MNLRIAIVLLGISAGAFATPEGALAQSSETNAQEPQSDEAVEWIEELSETVPDVALPYFDEDASRDSPHYFLERIDVQGTKKNLKHVVTRYVDLRAGEVFAVNDERLEAARYRLLATGLFSRVQLLLEKGSTRGSIVLVIKVKERNTIVVTDLILGLTRIAPAWDTITPFFGVGIADNSFLGTGIRLLGSVAAGKDQFAYKLGFRDDHFLNSNVGFHFEGLYVDGEENFGEHYLPGPKEKTTFGKYERLDFRRAGIQFGTGYNLLRDYFFWLDFRFENILADEPQAVEVPGSDALQDDIPVTLGYLQADASILTSFILGLTRDTRNHPTLPSNGSRTSFAVELSHPIMGSSYEYTKFTLGHITWFPLGKKKRQSLAAGGFAGLIAGNAPFFEQFFVGDYSAFAPNRTLGLNFSNLHPHVLKTSIGDMWYEDLVVSVDLTYSIAFYRGSGFVYGVDGFVNSGLFALTSSGKIGQAGFPMDLTADFGIRMDTRAGLFVVSFASVLQLIPPIRRETTQ